VTGIVIWRSWRGFASLYTALAAFKSRWGRHFSPTSTRICRACAQTVPRTVPAAGQVAARGRR
jgi:hypothetical protein